MLSKTLRTSLLLVTLISIAVFGLAQAQDPQGTITATYTLPDTRIADAQNAVLPDSVPNDRGMLLGGIGSDLWRAASDPADEYWMITDRGPNGQIRVDDKNRRTFPIPEFTPLILHVKVEGESITILETLPIVDGAGVPVTGLSNLPDHDEKPWDFAAATELTFNQNGLDSEGLVRTSNGDFWLADEYSPSIVLVNAEGQVVKRFVPEGLVYDATTYEVVDNLPAIYASRRGNRGFEGIAINASETTLFVVLQSPLRNPDADTGDVSRNTRILVFDIASETVVGEYVYVFQEATEFGADNEPGEMKLSGVVALSDTQLLILERTDPIAKLYIADLTAATNILGSAWDDAATAPSLEAIADFGTTDVVPVAKTLLIDLSTVEGVPGKIEGVAVIDTDTIAIANDNDFDINEFDADGNHIPLGSKSQILIIDLAQPLN